MLASVRTIYSRYRRGLSFILIGGGVAVFGSVQMYFYVEILHLEQNLAYVFQTFLSLQINFILNDRWTWGDWRVNNGNYKDRWLKYHLSRLMTILLGQFIFSLLVWLGIHYLVAYAVNIIIGFAINYITSSKFVFKQREVIDRI
jgi:dolichol-phosphate mannosyltransferase